MEELYTIYVYKDKKDTLLVIPYAKNDQGVRTNVNKPQIIEPPLIMEQLGLKTREAFEVAIQETYLKRDHVYVIAHLTGIKSWKKLHKEYLFVRAILTPDSQYIFYPGIGVTSDWDEEKGISLPTNATNEEMGTAVMNTFELHRLSRL
ncbi:hypothetical protein ACFPVX_22710 [Cohnella faecalis]|uniref:DUF1436 family protein n=1 Tax=Cohnella faecalis TaxID=2315694 RepID=A0A398CJZ7_9BACL|nr:hypothetical protein [Cohnella faecalis]RIE02462.1 hypothetical protein D3H35_17335 [Cohnella faecalis]